MRRLEALQPRSLAQPGRIAPADAKGLRAAVVVLPPAGVMAWHSTRLREELLIALAGAVEVQAGASSKGRRVRVKAGQGLFLPMRMRHRVVNRSAAAARYLYVTAPAMPRSKAA